MRLVACTAAMVAVVAPAVAGAFDTEPHYDITRDALAADGFGSLPPAGQETRTYVSGCAAGTHEARADYLNQVVESDETNNTRSIEVIC